MIALVLTMALVTYLIRVLPMAFIRRKIENEYLKSVLYYLPYTVLAAMTFPFVFYSTGNVLSAIVGVAVALIASISKRSLIVVAILSVFASFIILIAF
ncbi:MAG: AzlD domain-containing protein [Clostridia bacterium]|nr:AzlD domain-containing protein [Clostridia bacterium]